MIHAVSIAAIAMDGVMLLFVLFVRSAGGPRRDLPGASALRVAVAAGGEEPEQRVGGFHVTAVAPVPRQ